MDAVTRASKKNQSMKTYYKITTQFDQFLCNLVLYSFLGLTCSLICLSPYWFPSFCLSMKQFLFLHLSTKLSCFLGPKSLFIVVNVIVAFLVGESIHLGSPTQSSEDLEIYKEYVDRSRSIIRAGEGRLELELKLEEERVNISPVLEEKEIVKEEAKEVIITELPRDEEDKQVTVQEKEEEEEEDEEKGDQEIKKLIKDQDDESGLLPTEELNRRVEDFIARVNKQRWLEAKLLVCCNA